MKNITAFSLLFALTVNASAQKTENRTNFILTGQIAGRNNGLIWINYLDKKGKEIKDTTYLSNGNFKFKGQIDGATPVSLYGNVKSRSSDDPNFTELFIEPGKMTVTLTEGHFKNFEMTGSRSQADMFLLQKQKALITSQQAAIGRLKNRIIDQINKGDTSETARHQKDSILNKEHECRELERKADFNFISSHPASSVSPYLMNKYFRSRELSLDSAELFFGRFTSSVKESVLGKNIGRQIAQRKASAIGSKAPNFTKPDINGKSLTLSELKGKGYILLDFWASWCVPCRKDEPEIKKLYETYHLKGLDIISISWDSNKKAWQDAIASDGTGEWHQVFANVFLPNDNGLRDTYFIGAIPSLILIDTNGVIIGRYRGASDEGDLADLKKKLVEVFNKN
ncbi:MAG TPA: TlpA disulfide reductase family protein [Mucilaginibacter sp.]|jgi:peroxiredoxin|nr:TlpA disulfide reductase family protein [Mucilaginibacter sp.]